MDLLAKVPSSVDGKGYAALMIYLFDCAFNKSSRHWAGVRGDHMNAEEYKLVKDLEKAGLLAWRRASWDSGVQKVLGFEFEFTDIGYQIGARLLIERAERLLQRREEGK